MGNTVITRIEQALVQHLTLSGGPSAPPRLMAAMGHAVFPGGARIRPQLCVAVARACGQDAPALTDAAAVALEFMHCRPWCTMTCLVLTMPIPAVACPRCTSSLASHWHC